MNGQKIYRILFVHPLKICEQYGFIQSIFGSIIPKKHKNNPYYLPGSVAKFYTKIDFLENFATEPTYQSQTLFRRFKIRQYR